MTAGKHITIAIINQKGGVGKSTTSVNLSAALGETGKKVLVVDLDPQGNATSGFGVEKTKDMKCVYDGLVNTDETDDLIIKEVKLNIDIIPSTIDLAAAEIELVSILSRETRLKVLLDKVKDNYDFIVIDCPPSLGLLTINALTAADKLLIPIQCEYYALEGLTKLIETERTVKSHLNNNLEVLGVLITMFDGRNKLAKQVVEEVSSFFGGEIFDTVIPRAVKLAEAPSYGESILEYDNNGKGAAAYRDLAKEVISRVKS